MTICEPPTPPLKKSDEEVGKVGVKGDRVGLDKNINRHSYPLHDSTTE